VIHFRRESHCRRSFYSKNTTWLHPDGKHRLTSQDFFFPGGPCGAAANRRSSRPRKAPEWRHARLGRPPKHAPGTEKERAGEVSRWRTIEACRARERPRLSVLAYAAEASLLFGRRGARSQMGRALTAASCFFILASTTARRGCPGHPDERGRRKHRQRRCRRDQKAVADGLADEAADGLGGLYLPSAVGQFDSRLCFVFCFLPERG